MGPGILPETTVGKHNPPCHLQMPTKALSCKKEAICEHGPEAASCPVGQGSFKMDCLKVEKCSMVRRFKIWHSCWKSWMPACYQRSVQKPTSLMVWGWISAYGMGSLGGGYGWGYWGISPSVEIAIAFPSLSFFPLLPNQIILFQLLKLFSFVCNGKVIIFRFGFYKVNLEKRLEHFFC